MSPDTQLRRIEEEMLAVNLAPPGSISQEKEKQLQVQHQKTLLMQESLWNQRSRVNWALFGDRNSKFFRATAINRKKRNTIRAIHNDQGDWLTEASEVRQAFVSHFRSIFQKTQTIDVSTALPQDLLRELPQIPDYAHQFLCAEPTEQEIRAVLNMLGPHKAPGPDGFNAKILQDNWDCFGPMVVREVLGFFSTGVMSRYVARSNLVLVPKSENASKVEHYRPISVCNVIYKVITKIISLRLKPYIGGCISSSQLAFVPGRDISDSVVLMREIIHSFGQRGYARKEFCLKADLSKAFDRIDWEYLSAIMPLYGFPERLASWIKECILSAEYSVVINGVGDGFFKPQCGLRQGCALSPYLFILGMDLLARHLQFLVEKGDIQGVRVSRGAKLITSCIYADDLLIMGAAIIQEVGVINNALQTFSRYSGQKIGPSKSMMWFSNRVLEDEQEAISEVLTVPIDAQSDTYLGAPIRTDMSSFDFIIEKFSDRLQAWKGCLLSQAGRVILIQSVLQALPIYYMTTVRIPTDVIKTLTAMMRRFLWGAREEGSYMSYIAWDKITQPKTKGGLGLRSLKEVNEALLLKSLWKLAAGSDSPWV